MMTVLCLLAVALPAGFYLGINTLIPVSEDELVFDRDTLKGSIDVCKITSDELVIKGWAFLPDADANAPVRVLITQDNNRLFEVETRNVPRPDVDTRFDIDYRNSMVGFHASSSFPPANAKGPWRVLVIKPDAMGNLHGAYYECH